MLKIAAIVALTLGTGLAIGGCGFFGDDAPQTANGPSIPTAPDSSTPSAPDNSVRTGPGVSTPGGPGFSVPGGLDNIDRARGIYIPPGGFDITLVAPDAGPLSGGQQVVVAGIFPDLLNAESIYNIYFQYVFAPFDPAFADPFTAAAIYILTPPSPVPGFVDVSLLWAGPGPVVALEPQGYEYLAPIVSTIDVYRVVPDQGPLFGGQSVRVEGSYPVLTPITAVAAADSAYAVYFGNRRAFFDASVLPNPVVTAENMYVVTPPGAMPGFVNVTVTDLIYTINTDTEIDAYEYIFNFDLITVVPDQGPLSGGQAVRLGGSYPVLTPIAAVDAAYSAYAVYFGNRRALFDASVLPNPVITAENMYVLTPPGAALGFVDVTITDILLPSITDTETDGYEYISDFELFRVVPDNGYIAGNEPIRLEGRFNLGPTFDALTSAAEAYAAYAVYFGANRAAFDSAFTPVIDAATMYVQSPPSSLIGLVNVRIEDLTNPGIFTQLDQAFRYYGLDITAVVPNRGPISGGTPVRLDGIFPVANEIFTVAQAYASYAVFFDLATPPINRADFDGLRAPAPVITINVGRGDNSMFVVTPSWPTAGFVNVIVQDLSNPIVQAVEIYGFYYEDDATTGTWIDADVFPNPVGKLAPGELVVHLEVTGSVNNAFIVPQGGDPGVALHRIPLDPVSFQPHPNGSGNNLWVGTNAGPIRDIFNPRVPGLYDDGHAAIFIDEGNGNIIGDDFVDLSDGGQIEIGAQEGRHFLIDTLPPRVKDEGGTLTANRFVEHNNPPQNDADYIANTSNIAFGPLHPHNRRPAAFRQGQDGAPWDDGEIINVPRALGAQRFFNPASISNNWVKSHQNYDPNPTRFIPDPLILRSRVVFEDIDVHTALGELADPQTGPLAQQSALDEDRFNPGNRHRQVSGFPTEPGLTRTWGPFGARDDQDVLIGTSGIKEIEAQWRFAASASGVPRISDIRATYETQATPIDNQGFTAQIEPTNTEMIVTWEFDSDGDRDGGIAPGDAPENMHLQFQFRATDVANNYDIPNPADTTVVIVDGEPQIDSRGHKRNYTMDEMLRDPIHLWWLRRAGTEFTLDTVPSNEVTDDPRFEWTLFSEPQTNTAREVAPVLEPLFIHRIWATDPDRSRDETRNGPYFPVSSWTAWSNANQLGLLDFTAAGSPNPFGRWYILVVQACDEAGNIEQWPVDDLDLDFGATEIIDVTSPQRTARNWRRFYLAPTSDTIDTLATVNFWHNESDFDFLGDNADAFLGPETVVPLPPPHLFNPNIGVSIQRVEAEFRITMIVGSADPPNLAVFWELEREGQIVANSGANLATAAGSNVVFVRLPSDSPSSLVLGDPQRIRPIHYVFRAYTVDDRGSISGQLDGGDLSDLTPANIRFVVVPDVPAYIEGRDAADQQPTKEFERP